MSANVIKAKYTRPGVKGQSAASIVAYFERDEKQEPDQEQNPHDEPAPEQSWEATQPTPEDEPAPEPSQHGDDGGSLAALGRARTFGSRAGFVREANARAEAGRRASYVHLVVSPARGREFTDADFEELLEPLIRDRQGEPCAYYAAIHRGTPHPHLHAAVARSKYTRAELERLKALINERIREQERLHGQRADVIEEDELLLGAPDDREEQPGSSEAVAEESGEEPPGRAREGA
jgi:hypothetical protein